MDKIYFKNDYSEGAHPFVFSKLAQHNEGTYTGYGCDEICDQAKQAIKKHLERENVDIHFISGGTQTNLVMISTVLRPFEAVISSSIGHINTHETGAIEATGHKVIAIHTIDGKLLADQVENVIKTHIDEHMVLPKMVYISDSTENGLVYTKAELQSLRAVCDQYSLYLFMDGARLGSALCSSDNDVTLPEIAAIVDAFYIGGTKNGILFGEALVICNDQLKTNFRYAMKQRGAILAKGWVIGSQFLALFENKLFFELADHANTQAQRLKEGLEGLGVRFDSPVQTNQLFPILPIKVITQLQQQYEFVVWEEVEEGMAIVRLVTSWATKAESVDRLIKDLSVMLKK